MDTRFIGMIDEKFIVKFPLFGKFYKGHYKEKAYKPKR